MARFGIVVHGGAGPDSDHIKTHADEYKKGIQQAIDAGYAILQEGGTSIDAVEAAVNSLENNELFNAGRGAALNEDAVPEMCASIMNGADHKSGAVAIVKKVKNPVSLARAVMEKTSHIYLGDSGATAFADEIKAPEEPDAYFITDKTYKDYEEEKQAAEKEHRKVNEKMHGTVGAVALDMHGNIAAATSTGGTEFSKSGRIGDSSMIGSGSYASNKTCAVSATGDGEFNIRFVSAFHIAALMDYKQLPVDKACDYLIHEVAKDVEGDMGVIAIDTKGNIGMTFNSDRMHRGWKTDEGEGRPEIY